MPAIFGVLLALALGLFAGGADAGEELRPMHGPSRSGRNDVALAGSPAGAARGAALRPVEIRFTAESDYVAWKNALLRKPLMVAGGALELEAVGGYAAARPYVRLPAGDGGFIASLSRELTLK